MGMRIILGSAVCVAGAALALVAPGTSASQALLSRMIGHTVTHTAPAQGSSITNFLEGGTQGPNRGLTGPADGQDGQQRAPVQTGPSVYEQQLRQQRTKVPGPGPITAGPGPIRR